MNNINSFDNVLFGNGLSIKIIQNLKSNGITIIDFFDYLHYFLSLDKHKYEKRRFYKLYKEVVYDDEIPLAEHFILETIEEAKNIGFERMMSSKAFIVQDILTKYSITQEKYDRLFITASMYYFLLFNYWYVNEVLNKIDLNSICLLEISKKIKNVINDSIYTLSFDTYLDSFLPIKHVHGQFALSCNHFSDIVSMKISPTRFLYKFIFGTQGYEKSCAINNVHNHNIPCFDYEFMFGDKNFGNLLIYGVAFGLSNIIPLNLKGKYEDFYLMNCVEGHILKRLNELYKHKKIQSITIACYSPSDKSNYIELFQHLECNDIVKYINASELF